MAYCYIIYNSKLDRFYTGSTELETGKRLNLHLKKYYGKNKFTSAANDWQPFLNFHCKSIKHARLVESHIKKMKSKIYIQNLKKYPKLRNKLIRNAVPDSLR